MSSRQLVSASVWVTLVLVIGYILSFVKEAVVAGYYGISADVDAYTIAITIPVTLFAVVAVSIHSVVVPSYSRLLYTEGPKIANRYISNLISIVGVIAIVFVMICEISADIVIDIFAPGFDYKTHCVAVDLLRIILPTIIFTSIEKVLVGVLNVHKKFIFPSFSVYFLNIGLILGIILLHKSFGIKAACFGQILGSVLQVLFLSFPLIRYFKFSTILNFNDKEIRATIKQTFPIIWSTSLAEVCAVTNRMVASFLFVGSIAALGYASKLNGVMMTFFTSAIATIVYPLYSESAAKKDLNQLYRRVNLTLSIYSLFLIPLMLFVFCFKEQLVQIVFARGSFTHDDVERTQSLLGCYCFGILFMSFRETITKVFYSLHDTSTPAKNASIGVVLNIILNMTLPLFWGVEGLAIGTSLTAAFISIRLMILLKKKHRDINFKYFKDNIYKIVIAGIIMVGCLYPISLLCKNYSLFYQITLGTIVGVLGYSLPMLIMKNSLMCDLKKIFKTNK